MKSYDYTTDLERAKELVQRCCAHVFTAEMSVDIAHYLGQYFGHDRPGIIVNDSYFLVPTRVRLAVLVREVWVTKWVLGIVQCDLTYTLLTHEYVALTEPLILQDAIVRLAECLAGRYVEYAVECLEVDRITQEQLETTT